MKMTFRQSSSVDYGAICQLMALAFGPEGAATPDSFDLAYWKYWKQHPQWEGSRSYLIERSSQVTAHAAVWPMRLQTDEGLRTAMHVIDWAADPAVPGAGLLLLRNLSKMADVVFELGGSQMTREILPVFGFVPRDEVQFFAKPLRPLRQVLSHQYQNWKLPARLLRNTWWSMQSGKWNKSRTSAAPVHRSSPSVLRMVRTAELFEFFRDCPAATSELHNIANGSSRCVNFFLTLVPGQARLSDAWADSELVEDWAQLFQVALERALENPAANELTTIASTGAAKEALMGTGWKAIKRESLMVYDPKKLLNPAAPIHFQLLDSDGYFQHAGKPVYDT